MIPSQNQIDNLKYRYNGITIGHYAITASDHSDNMIIHDVNDNTFAEISVGQIETIIHLLEQLYGSNDYRKATLNGDVI
jgi:hypothetical protein